VTDYQGEARTPDTIDVRVLHAIPKAEALDRFGLTDDEYEAAMRGTEETLAALENREAQKSAPHVRYTVRLPGGRLRYDVAESGLVAVRRNAGIYLP